MLYNNCRTNVILLLYESVCIMYSANIKQYY